MGASMIKRLFLALALLGLSPAFGAGTVPGFSLSQQLDSQGRILSGCKFYTYAAGTTTPQSGYQDSALTLALPNPQTCDSAGRLPQMFFADGSIKIRLTSSAGVVQVTADGILVVGASSGGGGGSTVDATTILATGDLKAKYGTGVLTGFVRANGRTIGSATSGATERANADAQPLFEYLWGADTNLTVSTGRGASANADWVANKQLTLPDWRGRTLAALDDMGNSAAGRISNANFGTNPTVLGAAGGAESHTQTVTEMPAHAHTVPNINTLANGVNGGIAAYLMQGNIAGSSSVSSTFFANSGLVSSTGSGTAFNITQPTMLTTFYIKL
jgi:microcystin-dependent protein